MANSKHDQQVDDSDFLAPSKEVGIRLKIKNVQTGEVVTFASIGECARHFDVNGAKVHAYLNRKTNNVFFMDAYLLVKEDEQFPCPEEYSSWTSGSDRGSIVVFNDNEKKALIFPSLSDAAKHFDINRVTLASSLRRALSKGKKSTGLNNLVFTPIEHSNEYVKYVKQDLRLNKQPKVITPPKRKRSKVLTIDTRTGQERMFDDIYALAKTTGVSYVTFRTKLVNIIDGEMFYKHFKIKFVNT